jgi:gamma-glutamyltranspeptidase/glutathione hydrolase
VAPDGSVDLETGFSPAVADGLRKRGHPVATNAPESLFGGGQLIYRLADGYVAASDMRKDGQAVGF